MVHAFIWVISIHFSDTGSQVEAIKCSIVPDRPEVSRTHERGTTMVRPSCEVELNLG